MKVGLPSRDTPWIGAADRALTAFAGLLVAGVLIGARLEDEGRVAGRAPPAIVLIGPAEAVDGETLRIDGTQRVRPIAVRGRGLEREALARLVAGRRLRCEGGRFDTDGATLAECASVGKRGIEWLGRDGWSPGRPPAGAG